MDQKGLKMFGIELLHLSDVLQSVCSVKKNHSNICRAADEAQLQTVRFC